ncbi:MAG TPA: hypothetical protein VE177_00215, partial [Candidatus Binatus sp.]|nr:hypothetical protein [Candidatus Binatus sp.]
LREVFREFARDRRGTVFMSSHMMNEVESLCTSVAIIHSGKILFRGTGGEVVNKVLDYSVVTIETDGLDDATLQMIKEMPNVSELKIYNDKRQVDIIVKGHDDLRPSLSELIVKRGIKLYTIKTADNMLERAYIEALRRDKVD